MLGLSKCPSSPGATHPGRLRGAAGRFALSLLPVVLAGSLAVPAGGAPPDVPAGPPDAVEAGSPFAEIDLALEFGTYTYFGCRGFQGVNDLTVGEGGEAVVAGFFPVDCDRGFPEFFARKLTLDGAVQEFRNSLTGGEDVANGVALDAEGNIYITGATSSGGDGRQNFTVVDPFQPDNAGRPFTFDAFVVKLDPEAETILYATFLGGTGTDVGTGIAVDEEGRIVVVGSTSSPDFPTESPLQGGLTGPSDVFVTVFTPDGSELVFSTYFGGAGGERAGRLAVLRDRIFFTGTTSSPDLPTRVPGRPDVLDSVYGGGVSDAFVARIDRFQRLGYAGFLGGSGRDVGHDLELDRSGSAFVTGTTDSADFPTRRAAQERLAEPSVADVFLTRLAPSGARARYSTYLDVEGSAQCRGSTISPPFCTGVGVADDGTAFVTASGFFAIAVSKDGGRILGSLEGFERADSESAGIEVTDAGVFVAGSTMSFELPLEAIPHPAQRHIFQQVGWLVRLSRRSESGSGPP